MTTQSGRGAAPASARAVGDLGLTRSAAAALVGLIALALLISVGWLVLAAHALDSTVSRWQWEQQAFSDTRYYDEALTADARLGAATGDPVWAERYRAQEQALGASLGEALVHAGETPAVEEFRRVIGANDALVAIEHRALALAAAGNLVQARAELDSPEYAKEKSVYAEALAAAFAAHETGLADDVARGQVMLAVQAGALIVLVVLLVLLGRHLVRLVRAGGSALSSSMDAAVIGMAVASPDLVITYANPALARMLGRPLEDVVGHPIQGLVHPEDADSWRANWAMLVTGTSEALACRVRLGTGEAAGVWADVTGALVSTGEGSRGHLSMQAVDVTGEVSARRELERSAERFRVLAENATDVVAETDAAGVIVWISSTVESVLGYRQDELIGTHVMGVVDPRDRALAVAHRELLAENGKVGGARARFRTKAGDVRVMSVHIHLFESATGDLEGGIFGLHDVTADVEREEQLAYLAAHDPLTGASNRAELMAVLGASIVPPAGRSEGAAVLFCDVDGLREVNNSQGHLAGDAVLRAAADRLRGAVREDDLVARIGGDEFVLVCWGVHTEQGLRALAEHVVQTVRGTRGTAGPAVTVSVGGTLALPGERVDGVLARADEALYSAKAAGRDRAWLSG